MNKNHNMTVKTFEKVIDLIKFTHRPRTNEEIAKRLGYDDYTSNRAEISKLFRGDKTYKFLNCEFPFSLIREINDDGKTIGRRSCDGYDFSLQNKKKIEEAVLEVSTVNPIFLALNCTEVYLMTSRLLDILKKYNISDNEFEEYKNVISKILSQLSDYTIDRISNNYENSIFDEYDIEKTDSSKYEPEYINVLNNTDIILDLQFRMKSREETSVLFNGIGIKRGWIDPVDNKLYALVCEADKKRYIFEVKDNKVIYKNTEEM